MMIQEIAFQEYAESVQFERAESDLMKIIRNAYLAGWEAGQKE